MSMATGMGIFFFIFAFLLYIGIFALLFTVTYFVFKKAIKNGLIEAYREYNHIEGTVSRTYNRSAYRIGSGDSLFCAFNQ